MKLSLPRLSMASIPKSHPIPKRGHSIKLLHSNLATLAKVIQSGESIAVATNFAAVPLQERDATANAVKQMTPNELTYWQAYIENQFELPNINWQSDIREAPTSKEPLRTARRRAEALNYLYKTDQATPGHSVWFVEN